VAKRAVDRLRSRGRSRLAYRARKFPDLTLSLIDDRIARFRAALGRFGGISARQAGRNLFVFD
jgi:hypothetical protein